MNSVGLKVSRSSCYMIIDKELAFQQRQQQFIQVEQAAQRQHNTLAFWRLVWFIGSVIITWLFVQVDQQIAAIAILLIGIAGFLVFLRKHQAVKQQT